MCRPRFALVGGTVAKIDGDENTLSSYQLPWYQNQRLPRTLKGEENEQGTH